MKFLAKCVLCFAICSFPVMSFAEEPGGAGIVPAHARLAPLAAIMARAQLRGLRLRTIRWDAVLKQSWAVLEDAEHPDHPLLAELMDTTGPVSAVEGLNGAAQFSARVSAPKPYVALIHYGDRVRLWRSERNVRIEMTAIAEGSAVAGDEVKLRIPNSGVNGDSGWQVVGLVHGPGDVEMVQ